MDGTDKVFAIFLIVATVFVLGAIASCSYVAGKCVEAGGSWQGGSMSCIARGKS